MNPLLEIDFSEQVSREIDELGYKVTWEPTRVPNGKSWLNDPVSLVRGLKYIPNLLVENKEKSVIIELKTRVFLLAPVIQARQYADYFGSPVIICVPVDVFENLPRSVREFSSERNVRICSLTEIKDVLNELLH